ncbi:PLP-dependent aminotransferase family protein [Nonomuraea sp. NPDC050556]|uniref:PLP-dependent aminotransferase family protein n=1 Tax=Nonomuraea sp. NPDC050556 TaxID=3364369 RepID=UPI0037BB6AE2
MSDGSTSVELVNSLRGLIAGLAAGDRLPSSRELIQRFHVGPGTVSRAIAVLAAEGAVVTRPGSGTFVAQRARLDARVANTAWQTVALTDRTVDVRSVTDVFGTPSESTLMLDGGYLHRSLQPVRALNAALTRAGRGPDVWDRAPTAGLTGLRAAFAAFTGAGVSGSDVLVTGGGQSALSMAFRAIAGPGDPVLVESPTYPGALAAARAAGLRPVPVPLDDEGVLPDLLAEAFAMTGARLFYCQPAFHNPTGTVLAASRRAQVLDVARAAGAFVVEDDFGRHLGHAGAPPRPLLADDRDGTVVYVTSLTKPGAPSLRIGALIARGPVMERMRAIRRVDDFFVARPLQEAALELVTSPAWERHVRTLGTALGERAVALAAAVARDLPSWTVTRVPAGGLHLWARAPSSAVRIAGAARRYGVAVSAGDRYFAAEAPGDYVRLTFGATAALPDLAEAVRRLVRCQDGDAD